jgi:hypothetical protein
MSHAHTLAAFLILTNLAGIAHGQAPKAKDVVVRRLDLKGVKLSSRDAERGKVDKPVVITDSVGVAEAFPDEASQALIGKQVDFKKDKLLFFQWAGSGGDRLTPAVVDTPEGAVVEFRYAAGFTDDYQRHFHLFALPRTVKWRFVR